MKLLGGLKFAVVRYDIKILFASKAMRRNNVGCASQTFCLLRSTTLILLSERACLGDERGSLQRSKTDSSVAMIIIRKIITCVNMHQLTITCVNMPTVVLQAFDPRTSLLASTN